MVHRSSLSVSPRIFAQAQLACGLRSPCQSLADTPLYTFEVHLWISPILYLKQLGTMVNHFATEFQRLTEYFNILLRAQKSLQILSAIPFSAKVYSCL